MLWVAMPLPVDTLLAAGLLALLLFTLVTCTLSTLAARMRGQKLRHDLVRESRRRRQDYLDSLPGAHAASNVDVIEEPVADQPEADAPARRAA